MPIDPFFGSAEDTSGLDVSVLTTSTVGSAPDQTVTPRDDVRPLAAPKAGRSRTTGVAFVTMAGVCLGCLLLGVSVYQTLASVRISGDAVLAISGWAQVAGFGVALTFVMAFLAAIVLIRTRGSRVVPALTLALAVVGPLVGFLVGGNTGLFVMLPNLQADVADVSQALMHGNAPSWLQILVRILT